MCLLDPSPNAAYAGKLVGDAAQSFKQFGYQLLGAQSAEEARAQWAAGNHLTAAAKEGQAFVEAFTTITGAAAIGKASAPAVRAIAGSFAETADIMAGNAADRFGFRLSMTEPASTGVDSFRPAASTGLVYTSESPGVNVLELTSRQKFDAAGNIVPAMGIRSEIVSTFNPEKGDLFINFYRTTEWARRWSGDDFKFHSEVWRTERAVHIGGARFD
ncbi:hypothetical protein [Burkholderia sp. SRS-W-2-2016]|uniref:hypothetical protein n=1 Tax=Burkholderia sp. SRS-W-2-2016 TaxID=1926878 RepID=UPI00117D69A2|nr:hypothetical protein [Burkholderia sp. SRS-W-2-2016]